MLKLVFAEAGPSPTMEIGPLPEICIDGETLRAARDGEVLGRHHQQEWIVHGRKFFRVDCSCPDGIAYGDGDICANIDLESKKWYCHRDRKYWQSLVVKSAAASAG